jgi:hypothetical protein
LNYALKKEDEQKFIYQRLNLVDQQYFLEMNQHLWQSYVNIGLQKHIWPVSLLLFVLLKAMIVLIFFFLLSLSIKDELYKMAGTTNDTKLCYEYLMNYLENIKQQLNQCQLELSKQSQSCPITNLSLNQIDHCLKEYVHTERNYLLTRNNEQFNKFQDNIREKDLYKTIVSYQLNINLVSTYNIVENHDRFFSIELFSCF